MRTTTKALAAAMAMLVLLPGTALAQFTPVFTMTISDTKVLGHPQVDLHLEFDADDEEIGNFQLVLPKGYAVAGDDAVPEAPPPLPIPGLADGEVIGQGTVSIEAGIACRPGPEGAIPLSAPVDLDATIYERSRTDEEIDAGVHAVWFLDLEPLNRVRLLVKGSPLTGWTIEGAPTPSDNTCNPLTVDLTINAESESGIPLITNPAKPGKKILTANITGQDTGAVATFTQVVQITR
jgi:hypothetical protein